MTNDTAMETIFGDTREHASIPVAFRDFSWEGAGGQELPRASHPGMVAQQVNHEAVLHYPGLTIHLERKIVTAGGEEVRLSRTEWDLLGQLASNAGRVMMHTELLSRIWGPEYRNETQYLRTWVSRRGAKMEPPDNSLTLITTYLGMGYQFESPPPATE